MTTILLMLLGVFLCAFGALYLILWGAFELLRLAVRGVLYAAVWWRTR
jgi:hypothetical protein